MSGVISDNTVRSSGAIAPLTSATTDANNPALDTNPTDGVGTKWVNTTSGQIFICTDATTDLNKWIGQEGGVVSPARGIFWTGTRVNPDTMTNIIDYITIDTLGDATDFGDITAKRNGSACSNGVAERGLYGGGQSGAPPSSPVHNEISYITISSTGNAADFGDLTQARSQVSSTSNGSDDRGVWFGGYSGSATTDRIDYVTISTLGNATDFGNTSPGATQDTSATSNGTNERGIFSGGNRTSISDVIDYITISSPGNATDFGNLLAAKSFTASCSNLTNERGCIAGGSTHTNVIQYVTINSTGNATDFGDLLSAMYGAAGTSNGTTERGVYGGGYPGPVNQNVIQYITISSTGNATDFGDMTVERSALGACSDAG